MTKAKTKGAMLGKVDKLGVKISEVKINLIKIRKSSAGIVMSKGTLRMNVLLLKILRRAT